MKNCGNQDFLLWRWLFHFHNFWMVENCLLSYFFFECYKIFVQVTLKQLLLFECEILLLFHWGWFLILEVWNIRNLWICSIELFVFANMKNKDYWNKIYVMLFPSYLTIKIKNLLKMWIWKEIWGSNMCWINYGNFMIAYFYNSS